MSTEMEELFAGDQTSWTHWRKIMEGAPRCVEGREAGLWALGILERALGPTWLRRALKMPQVAPLDIVTSPSFMALAYVDLLDLATSLADSSEIVGYGKVRRAMAGDVRLQEHLHARLQLEVANLGMATGATVHLEKRLAEGLPPVDVLLEADGMKIAVETRVLLLDDQMREGQERADAIGRAISNISMQLDVHFTGNTDPMGSAGDAIDDADVDGILEAVRAAAERCHAGQQPVRVDHPMVDLRAVPQFAAEVGTGYGIPAGVGRGLDRTRGILLTKADQMIRSGARWLRLDVLDGTYGFSTWWQLQFGARVWAVNDFIRAVFNDAPHVRGVVWSSSALTAIGWFPAETSWPRATHGLRRRVDTYRARETIVMPLIGGAEAEAEFWRAMYEGEYGHLERSLASHGFPSLDVLMAVNPL